MLFPALGFKGQIVKVDLQASGLTCSMCSNAINKAIRSLDFVDKVDANIKNSSFVISFKDGLLPDLDMIRKKVENAGYTVAKFWVTLNFNHVDIENEKYIVLGNYNFHFFNVTRQTLNGNSMIRLIDKGYVSNKEFKKNIGTIKIPCYTNGEADGKKAYHVTL